MSKINGKKTHALCLVGGNPTMNTLRLRRGGGITSSSSLVFYLYWYSYIVYFVCDSASEFGAMGSTFFLGFSCPNLLLVFLNFLLFLGTSVSYFFASVGSFSGSFLFYFYFYVPYYSGLACDHGNSFLCLEE